MRRRDFLSRLLVGIGLAPLVGILQDRTPSEQDIVVLRSTTAGSFSNNFRVEFVPGSVWIDDANKRTYQCINVTEGETIWLSSGTYDLPLQLG